MPVNHPEESAIIQAAELLSSIKKEMQKVIVGQEKLLDRILVALMCHQHILLEGVPGLAKTLTVTTLAGCLNMDFKRIQFTPDLLPADLIGTLILDPSKGGFTTRKGPLFTHLVLADEINRAPAKVQSALLEAMQEHQVTIGETTFPLPEPFFVMATQNPVEQEGTYPLPEAQVDRFMMKLKIDYPQRDEEIMILRTRGKIEVSSLIKTQASPRDILALRHLTDSVYCDPHLEEYMVDLVRATRQPDLCGLDIAPWISYGASPRATLYLSMGAKALALLAGRGFVTPQDIKEIAPDILRHRIIISYEAEADGKSSEDIISMICESCPVP